MTDDGPGVERHPVGERTLLAGGRVKIPATRIGVERGDEVHVEVEKLDTGHTFGLPNETVGSSGRITIPADVRRDQSLSKGERIALTVYVEGG